MKSLQELFDQIMASDDLKKQYAQSAQNDTLLDFAKSLGVETTLDEIKEFIKEKMNQDTPLSLDDMEAVAGGGAVCDMINTETIWGKCMGRP